MEVKSKTGVALAVGFLVLLVNSGYLRAFPNPNLFYVANVMLHIGLGAALFALFWIWRRANGGLLPLLVALAGITGFALAIVGAQTPYRWLVLLHIACCAAAAGAIGSRWQAQGQALLWRAFVAAAIIAIALPVAGRVRDRYFPNPADRIVNPKTVALSMEEEGPGPASPFFPAGANTNTGKIIPSDFFLDSKACAQCHKDIYEQWSSSMHHFASFNNQFYRKSIEHMQDVVGTKPSKWCAGCHDHAVFFNGRFDRPIKEQIDTPQAQGGLGCMSCHSITNVHDTTGNTTFTIEYPPLHELTTSQNPVVRGLHYYLINTAPEPHRRAFMKPFMRMDSAEFCASCHKVHLDIPVNHYRWLRGFNEYDNWQASGVSGQGARSFYYPAKSSTCADCHMPLVASRDPGNRNGFVHSHRFPGANTAVPFVNQDAGQLQATEQFLKDGALSVDIFAVSPIEASQASFNAAPEMRRRASDALQAASSFAVGEESEGAAPPAVIREVGRVAAPIDRASPALKPGATVRVDVVVRTRKVGHFFPGGTVDAFDVWLELKGEDETGRVVFWSGKIENDTQVEAVKAASTPSGTSSGPVDPGAHFYRSYQLDEHGNMINKRNAWQTRSVLYVRLIPPGAADVAHYRLRIPRDAKGSIKLTARLNYRKFSYYYTQFSYVGQPQPGAVSADFDDRNFTFRAADIPANVSGKIKGRVPDLPVVTIAQAQTTLRVANGGSRPAAALDAAWQPVVRREDRERWNDWGIGLLLQGDLKGGEYAFKKVTEAEPGYADGWLNVARAYIQEGETDAAKPYLAKAVAINPSLGRIHYFRALVEKADGDYDAALRSLRLAEAQYPRDRVVLNQIGRILFLKRDYRAALAVLDRVCAIDPEDVAMHYTMMLCHRGLGEADAAAREEKLFKRFKADEASQAITGRPRLASPEDNNERQAIHDHESAPLTMAGGAS